MNLFFLICILCVSSVIGFEFITTNNLSAVEVTNRTVVLATSDHPEINHSLIAPIFLPSSVLITQTVMLEHYRNITLVEDDKLYQLNDGIFFIRANSSNLSLSSYLEKSRKQHSILIMHLVGDVTQGIIGYADIVFSDRTIDHSCNVVLQDRTCKHDISSTFNYTSSCSSACDLSMGKIEFSFLGDWGEPGDGLRGVVESVKKRVNEYIVLGGDNFYQTGVVSLKDSQFNETYEAYFRDVSVPQHVILGNHDYIGNVLPQLLYESPWWNADYYFYHKIITVRNTSICAVFIDTEEIDQSGQFAFLHTVLSSRECQKSNAIVVNGHHPVFSIGGHGDSSRMQLLLMPILELYGVDLYVSGHDHVLSHHRHHGVEYVVSGASSKKTTSTWYISTSNAEETIWGSINQYGYSHISVIGDHMQIEIIDIERDIVISTQSRTTRRQERLSSNNTNPPIEPIGQRPWSSAQVWGLAAVIFLSWAGSSSLAFLY